MLIAMETVCLPFSNVFFCSFLHSLPLFVRRVWHSNASVVLLLKLLCCCCCCVRVCKFIREVNKHCFVICTLRKCALTVPAHSIGRLNFKIFDMFRLANTHHLRANTSAIRDQPKTMNDIEREEKKIIRIEMEKRVRVKHTILLLHAWIVEMMMTKIWNQKKSERKKKQKPTNSLPVQIHKSICLHLRVAAFNFISTLFRFFSHWFLPFSPWPCCILCFHYHYRLLACWRNIADAIDDDEFRISGKVAVQTVEAIESESIVLSCGRTKMPANDVKWFFNGKFYLMVFCRHRH